VRERRRRFGKKPFKRSVFTCGIEPQGLGPENPGGHEQHPLTASVASMWSPAFSHCLAIVVCIPRPTPNFAINFLGTFSPIAVFLQSIYPLSRE